MDELIERYVNYLQNERNASPHTIRNYRSDLAQFRDFLTKGKPDARVEVLDDGNSGLVAHGRGRPQTVKSRKLKVESQKAKTF